MVMMNVSDMNGTEGCKKVRGIDNGLPLIEVIIAVFSEASIRYPVLNAHHIFSLFGCFLIKTYISLLFPS